MKTNQQKGFKMKKFHLITLAITLLIPSLSFADSGKAMLSHFYASTAASANRFETFLYISNVASEEVTVTVTFYDNIGNIISDTTNSPTAGVLKLTGGSGTYTDNVPSYSARYQLGSNESSRVWLDIPTLDVFGYAIVEWYRDTSTSDSRIANALVAHNVMYRVYGGSVGYYDIAINNGNPF